MQISSILRRAREAHQRALARADALDNVKLIASAAAAARANQAAAAGLHENRQLSTPAFAVASEPPRPDFRGLSENPDQGRADED